MALSSVDTLALNAAAANGDANPTTINSILTTRGNAYQAIWSGAGAPVDPESVYAITMHGSFNDSQWHPPGVATRNYGFFTIVVDAATGTPVDANLRASSVDIGVLGQLTQLPSLNQGVLTGEIRTSVAKQARTCHGPKCDNTRVAAVSHGRVSASQRVGADGTFRLVVPDGAYSVRAGHGCAARYAHVSHTKTVQLMIRCR
jgi:hypothetical protein